jgi:transposase
LKKSSFYSDDKASPTDPLNLFKMLFIGYLYGIRSERQLEKRNKIKCGISQGAGKIKSLINVS